MHRYNCVSKQVNAPAHEYVCLIEVMHPTTQHGVGVIIQLHFAIFAEFKESMTSNPAQRSFKVIYFDTNRKRVYTVSQKNCANLFFCQNFAKFRRIVKIFGTKIAEN